MELENERTTERNVEWSEWWCDLNGLRKTYCKSIFHASGNSIKIKNNGKCHPFLFRTTENAFVCDLLGFVVVYTNWTIHAFEYDRMILTLSSFSHILALSCGIIMKKKNYFLAQCLVLCHSNRCIMDRKREEKNSWPTQKIFDHKVMNRFVRMFAN